MSASYTGSLLPFHENLIISNWNIEARSLFTGLLCSVMKQYLLNFFSSS